VDAYREYCWPVESLDDIRLAPFHLLATEGMTHTDKDHIWHMETISKYCVSEDCGENKNSIVIATPYLIVDTMSEDSVAGGVAWWEKLTAEGGEGMVVKPLDFIAEGMKGRVQPAMKCRGAEYLRIIYGPEYLLPENLPRLKSRSLGKKRSLAMREFALGIESLERFCRKEPFYRVHECVFGVLAMESEPVDPRL
jgi:protein phosphatase